MNWYIWLVFIHVLGAFGFALAHGTSAAVALKLRGERNPDRIAALLDLSGRAIYVMYGSLLVLLVAGVAAGFVGGWWGRLWIWAALVILFALLVSMYLLASRFYEGVRHAAGVRGLQDRKTAPDPVALSAEELDRLLASRRPFLIATVGGVGLVVLLWLMYFKPF